MKHSERMIQQIIVSKLERREENPGMETVGKMGLEHLSGFLSMSNFNVSRNFQLWLF